MSGQFHCYLGKREDSPNWYIYEYDPASGYCERISTRTADHSKAQEKLAEHIIKLPQRVLVSNATVLHVMLRYWELCAQHHESRDTAKSVLRLITKHAPTTPLYAESGQRI
jgi:hypothetical protein